MTNEETTKQVEIAGWLVPEEAPIPETEDIAIDRIVDWETGPKPSADLVDSVRDFGVVKPVVVRRAKRGNKQVYEVIDGRRRIAASIKCEYETVPARVYSADFSYESVLTLSLNVLRSSNPIAELEAIGKLLLKGAGEREIARATGLHISTIRKRLQLQDLKPEIKEAVREGKIKVSVAEKIAKLSPKDQTKVKRSLKKDGKVTMREVSEIKRAKAADVANTIPMDVFKKTTPSWQQIVADRMDQTLKLIPEVESALRDEIRNIIISLDTREEHKEVSQ